jgi:GWxTD domain-containing protein
MVCKLRLLLSLLVLIALNACRAQGPSRQELVRRIAFADAHFAIPPITSGLAASPGTPGSKTDRGKIYIALGPPDEVRDGELGPGPETCPVQIWTYRAVPGVGKNVRIEFVDPVFISDYRILPPTRDEIEARRRYELIQKLARRTPARISGPHKEGN